MADARHEKAKLDLTELHRRRQEITDLGDLLVTRSRELEEWILSHFIEAAELWI